MRAKLIIILCVFECYQCEFGKESNYKLNLILKWNTLDYEWPNKESKSEAIINKTYIPQNSCLRDFKLWRDSAFVTIPRWKSGIPVTLAKINISSDHITSSPVLQPFPSWSMQKLDDCFALQSVHTIETDSEDRLWILDNGMVEEMQMNRTTCPPKLVIIDLKTNFIIRSVAIPTEIVQKMSTIASMALDRYNKVAYIADSNYDQSGFLRYDFNDASFRRFACEHLNIDEDSYSLNNIPANLSSYFVSVSLNTDRSKLYFSIFDSEDLFLVNTTIFYKNITDISEYVENMGTYGRSVELISDTKGYMYFDILDHKAVAQWRENSWVFQYTPRIIAQSKLLCHWISSLEIDEEGYLWIISSRFYDYVAEKFYAEKENFRIFRTFVPRLEHPKRPKTGFNAEYVVLILFIIIIGLIIIEILMFNAD